MAVRPRTDFQQKAGMLKDRMRHHFDRLLQGYPAVTIEMREPGENSARLTVPNFCLPKYQRISRLLQGLRNTLRLNFARPASSANQGVLPVVVIERDSGHVRSFGFVRAAELGTEESLKTALGTIYGRMGCSYLSELLGGMLINHDAFHFSGYFHGGAIEYETFRVGGTTFNVPLRQWKDGEAYGRPYLEAGEFLLPLQVSIMHRGDIERSQRYIAEFAAAVCDEPQGGGMWGGRVSDEIILELSQTKSLNLKHARGLHVLFGGDPARFALNYTYSMNWVNDSVRSLELYGNMATLGLSMHDISTEVVPAGSLMTAQNLIALGFSPCPKDAEEAMTMNHYEHVWANGRILYQPITEIVGARLAEVVPGRPPTPRIGANDVLLPTRERELMPGDLSSDSDSDGME